MRKPLTVYTDGAATTQGTQRFGGWAWFVTPSLKRSGGAIDTTSNRMEITAVINAMLLLKSKAQGRGLLVVTDSLYVVDFFAERWYQTWSENNWLRHDFVSGGWVEVKNRDLWESLLAIYQTYLDAGIPVTFKHIRGHGKDKNADPVHVAGNDQADRLAVAAKQKVKKNHESAYAMNKSQIE